MKVFIEKEDKEKNIKFKGSVLGLLNMLKINPETVVVVKNSRIVTGEENLSNGDEVGILSVISGG